MPKAKANASQFLVELRKEGSRAVLVNGEVAFDQSSTSGVGVFVGEYADMQLPGKS